MVARKAAQAAARPKTTPPPEREDIWAAPHQPAARRQNDRDPAKKRLRRERRARVEQMFRHADFFRKWALGE
jgi:hypothetical protein